ncbi:hypothetical protein ACUOGS_24230, partial [Escherichia coli]
MSRRSLLLTGVSLLGSYVALSSLPSWAIPQPDSPQLRGAIKEELINREILMQEADKQGLSNST